MWLINVSLLQLPGRGRSCHSEYVIYVFLWHESEAQGLSAHWNKKVGKHFPLPSLLFWLHFHLPLLDFLDFPSLICLNEINGHFCGQIYQTGIHCRVSQQTKLTPSKTTPTAITDSIMLSKGTWRTLGFPKALEQDAMSSSVSVVRRLENF